MGLAHPTAVVVAGPNGSGKTTFAREYLLTHPMEYISADEIAAGLAPAALDEVRLQAGRLFFERINDRIEGRTSFLAETTLAGKGFHRFVQRLSQANYTVILVFVYLESPELCLARVRQRVRKGGHAIPESDVLRRFDRSLGNFWHQYRLAVTRWHLVQNSGTSFEEVAIGHAGRVLIKDNDQYQAFLRVIGEPGNE
jgi:predicted ABC-type ATPase